MITVVEPRFYWPETTRFDGILQHIERCGRICYKSESRLTEDSSERFVKMIRQSGHESVLEHVSLTAIVVCSRACSHQLVRHRISAFSQESMRFCNYGKSEHLQVVCPPSIGLDPGYYDSLYELNIHSDLNSRQLSWLKLQHDSYMEYLDELANGILPEDARYSLTNATKTELATTFDLRQWRHVFKERALNKHAQWEIRNIFSGILADLKTRIPVVFDDLA
jgi:thymidylate synthase (FAD)